MMRDTRGRAATIFWVGSVAISLVIFPFLSLAQNPAVASSEQESLLQAADYLAQSGQLDLARETYERALAQGAKIDNDHTRARLLGLCYLNGSPPDFSKAARWLDAAWRLQPDAEDVHFLLARALLWGGEHERAMEHFRSLVQLNPENEEYVLGLSAALSSKNDYAQAVEVLTAHLGRYPANTRARLEYARTLSYTRRFDEALEQYKKILETDPTNLDAQIGVARLAAWLNDLETALERYNRILKRYPDNHEAIVGRAFVFFWMGDLKRAQSAFRAAVRLDPSDKEVASTLQMIEARLDRQKSQ